ncbi:MAG: ECF transporter S component [Candidatus Anoxymicrobium japonicum]|uniref:ECF transporter S component n=1 Tax=Candidatus Anoxymicrobium japonicum TaxID=2013648 RepID=A0A2N3G5P5_9ACTN|nr:MAG: ECF transporter S component [Candidatus Anoxymicrobium japonicum]
MRKSNFALLALLAVIGAWIAGELSNVHALANLTLMASLTVTLILLYYYLRFEEKKSDAKNIAIIGTLAALSVTGRCLFAAVPNVKPSTFIIIITGYVFGPLPGFMVGATTALVSNFFFGQGPWTIWQMLAWGLAGLVSGLLGPGRRLEGRWTLALYCAMWGLLFGWIMNLYFVLGFVRPINFNSFFATYAASLWFDALHAAGNFFFAFLLGASLVTMLRRYQARFFFETVADPRGPVARVDDAEISA